MPPSVRPARPHDVPGLVAAYEWLFAPPGSRPEAWDPDRAAVTLAELIGSPRAAVLLAGDDGEIAGFASVYLDIRSVRFGQRAWVEDLAVHPEHRSRGLGKALLDAARSWAAAQGATHLELDSGIARTDAHRFYEREGAINRSLSFAWPL